MRAWRLEFLEGFGGDTVPAAERATLDADIGAKITLSSPENFLFQLAGHGQPRRSVRLPDRE